MPGRNGWTDFLRPRGLPGCHRCARSPVRLGRLTDREEALVSFSESVLRHGLTASHFTIAGSPVGAGYGTKSPWPFEVRVEAASAAGYRSIGLGEADYSGMRASGTADEELLEILDRHRIRVAEIEFLFDWMHDDEDARIPARIAENLFRMAKLFRPHHVNVGDVRYPPGRPLDLVTEKFGVVCDRLEPFGVKAAIEFMPWTSIPDLDTAGEIVRRAGRENAGIHLDTWHYFRGPSCLGQLERVDPASILSVALNDAGPPLDDMVLDTTRHRLLPGEGTFDLEGFLADLAATGARPLMGVEILSDRQTALHPARAARESFDAATEVLARAGRLEGSA